MAGSIALREVTKAYAGAAPSLLSVDLEVPEGTFQAIVGPSGSGKSTLLRLIAGLVSPSAGSLLLDGVPAAELAPRDRGVAMVFQNQPPFPHLNVHDNLAFSLRPMRLPKRQVAQRVAEVAALLGLDALLGRRPDSLSGGEQRRVVLGRAVARRPRILLLDEPLTGLDAPLRTSMRTLLADLHRTFAPTVLLVTHDQSEAMALGERIALLHGGRLIQNGTPEDIYERPRSVEVARFLGEPPMNIVPARLVESSAGLVLELPGPCRVPLDRAENSPTGSGPVLLGLRPEHFLVREDGELRGTVLRIERMVPDVLVDLDLGGHCIRLRSTLSIGVRRGDAIRVRPQLEFASWFDPATGRRIERSEAVQSGG